MESIIDFRGREYSWLSAYVKSEMILVCYSM